ncbi:CFC_collapsed_G0057460.mRNA.1.CDS.1 [Saccharomyces cerevisiae]|nr:CFC_collapsed_G0057460.mRNA.1.CDS.1 [Saccharomyces cerevisiae]
MARYNGSIQSIDLYWTNHPENPQRLQDVKSKLLNDPTMQNLQNDILDQFNEKLGIGARIKLSHAIGIPLCVIVGLKKLV